MLAVDVEKQLGALQLAVRFKAAGGATALFGPSGAGKTSLVNMIAGLLTPDAVLMVEHDKRFDPGEGPAPLQRYRKVEQGDAVVSFYRRAR